jgi:DNA-binding Xre family transcriptional regulator
MVVFSDTLKSILRRRNISQDEFAVLINVSVSAFKKQLAKNNLPLDIFDRICTELQVSPSAFLHYEHVPTDPMGDAGSFHKAKSQEKSLKNCQDLLAEKERIIKLLEDKIHLLERISKN